MNEFLTNLLKEKHGITDITNADFKPLDENMGPEDVDTGNARDVRIAAGLILTPKEVNEEIDKVLKYNFT